VHATDLLRHAPVIKAVGVQTLRKYDSRQHAGCLMRMLRRKMSALSAVHKLLIQGRQIVPPTAVKICLQRSMLSHIDLCVELYTFSQLHVCYMPHVPSSPSGGKSSEACVRIS
jgi:hypothetical protein